MSVDTGRNETPATRRTPNLPGQAMRPTTLLSSARLVAEREVREAVRAKGFWINFAIFVVGIVALAVLPGLVSSQPSVAALGPDAVAQAEAADFEVRTVDDEAAAARLVRDGDVDAAVVPDAAAASPLGLTVIALTEAPPEVLAALSVAPDVELLDSSAVSGAVRYIVVFAFGLIFFMFAIMFGVGIAQSVVIEKQTRIVEILVSTIPVRALLAGKIAGNSLLALSQVATLALVAPIALRLGGQGDLLGLLGASLGWFVPFFVFGFVLLAAMWAVAGALVSRQEDLASSTSLVSMLAMFPYFGVILFQDNPDVMTVLSYIPFSSTVAMPVRLFTGEAEAWEPVVALGLLAVSVVIAVAVASRLYSGSLMQTGGKVQLRKAWARSA